MNDNQSLSAGSFLIENAVEYFVKPRFVGNNLMELFQIFCPAFTLLNTPMVVLYNIALWLSAVLTVISGVNYLIQNKACLGLKNL